MSLPGPQLELTQNAILVAFSRDELRLLLRNHMDASFDAIVSETNLTVQAYELLEWADRQDRTEELLSALLSARPNNAELQAAAAAVRTGESAAAGPERGRRRSSNVPLQRPPRVKRFTGRQAELAQLLADLQPGRVVTLAGPGGMGKSALAAEAVWTLAPAGKPPARFPDGIVFHSFYDQPQSLLALEQIARAYDLEPSSSPRDAALQALAGRQALIVLDGAEEADDLEVVLAVTGSCGVLITTRLRQQAPDTWQDVAPLPDEDSRGLLRAWGGPFAEDDDAAGEIVRLLGGLPLAITLIGRYMAQQRQPAAEAAARLQEEGLAALHVADRPSKSILLLLERSLAQVSPAAQAAFGVAGVLALAPFARYEVAAALDLTPAATGRALGELVDYGLLLRTAEGYSVSHALAHTYARTEAAPEAQVIERLAWHYHGWIQQESSKGVTGFDVLDRQRAHIVAVQAAALSHEQWTAVIDLAWSLRTYLDLRAHSVDRVTVMLGGLEAAWAAGHLGDQGAFLNSLGLAHAAMGDFRTAIGFYEERLLLAKQVGDRTGQRSTLGNLGTAYASLGEHRRAVKNLRQALKLAQEDGLRNQIGSISGNLGITYIFLGKASQAKPLFERQLAIAREFGDRRDEANALGNLAMAYEHLGKTEKVADLLEQQVAIAREIGDRRGEAIALGNLGGVFTKRGEPERAIALHEQYLAIARATNDRAGESIALANLGGAYAVLEEMRRAIELYGEALALTRATGDQRAYAMANWNLGLAYEKEGDLARAVTSLQVRVEYERAVGHPDAAAHAEYVADVQARLDAGRA